MDFLSLEKIAFTVVEYDLSYIELVATIAGLIAVWLASKNNILTWPIGLINIVLFFWIFYQINLYSDMGLQVYFFITGIIGWIVWSRQKGKLKKITSLSVRKIILVVVLSICGTILFGHLASHLHIWFPNTFQEAAAYPYWDALTTSLSIIANLLLALRILQSWILWVIVDVIGTILYFQKDVLFIAILFFIFLIIAVFGHFQWRNEYRLQSQNS